MLLTILLTALAVSIVSPIVGGNEIVILAAPKTVQINPTPAEPIHSSSLSKIVDGILGLTAEKNDLITSDMWSRPEAVVVVELIGVPNYKPLKSAKPVKLNFDANLDLEGTNEQLNQLYRRGKDHNYNLIEVSTTIMGYYDQPITLETQAYASVFEHQVDSIKSLLKWMKQQIDLKNGVPDVFSVRLENSTGDVPAKSLSVVESSIEQIKATLKSIYDDNFVMLLVKVDDVELHRSVRAAKDKTDEQFETESSVEKRRVNLAQFYDDNYPVIFNIILWFMIAFGITIAGIAVWIWFMDPGKDSIIYRMTMARAKKD